MRKKWLGVITVTVLFIVMTCITAQAENLSVAGIGSTYFYVYDSDLNELAHAFTNQQIELASGTYIVRLNNTSRTVTIAAGQNTVVKVGSVSVAGTGSTYFYVYGSGFSELAHAFTNQQIELFPGSYTVRLNNTARTATVKEGENTVVKASRVSVAGTGSTYFYAYDSNFSELAHAFTNQQIELFPGSYTVRLNNTARTATVKEGENTVVKASSISVAGNGSTYFYVYESGFSELAHAFTNQQIELFPGSYTVKLNKIVRTATVQEGQITSVSF